MAKTPFQRLIDAHAPAQPLLTAEDVAERLGVPRSWVYAQARANKIPSVALGHYRRFRPETIDTWVKEMEAGELAGGLR